MPKTSELPAADSIEDADEIVFVRPATGEAVTQTMRARADRLSGVGSNDIVLAAFEAALAAFEDAIS